MIKNVVVFDSEGKLIGMTYPKRAQGLVKNGRARYYAGLDTAIILASSPETNDTSQEDEIMSNYNNEELRERIENLLREAKDKVDSVCQSAADAIDDLVEKIDDSEDVTREIEENEIFIEGEDSDEGEKHGRWISDEDMEKLKAKMANLRESLGRVTEEVKTVAVKTGTEIGKYAEAVKAKVTEKLAEREADSAAKAEDVRDGKESYYLAKIAEIQADKAYIEDAIFRLNDIKSGGPEDIGAKAAAEAIEGIACTHADTNRQLLKFYMEQLNIVREESRKSVEQANLEAKRSSETPEERRARLIAEDPVIRDVLNRAASNPGDAKGAMTAAGEFVTVYIHSVYGGPHGE